MLVAGMEGDALKGADAMYYAAEVGTPALCRGRGERRLGGEAVGGVRRATSPMQPDALFRACQVQQAPPCPLHYQH